MAKTTKTPKDENSITIIRVRIKTRQRLKKLGAKGESYDQVIEHLLDKNPA